MTFRVVDFSSIPDLISSRDGRIVVIIAPNFEERSLTNCKSIIKTFRENGISRERVEWIVLTLQGGHPPEILDAVKSVYTRAVITSLMKAGYARSQVTHQPLQYPLPSREFTSVMAQLFRGLGETIDLIVDFSALPRNLLSTLLGEVSRSGCSDAAFPNVRTVWLVYARACGYPEHSGPEFVGNIIGQFTGLPFRQLLRDKDHAEVVLVTGGSGHDAFEVLGVVEEARRRRQINLHLVNYISDEDLNESLRKLRHHHGLLREAQRMGAEIRYVFSYRHALSFMRQIARGCAGMRISGSNTLLAIAPFGPKPLAVAAHFAREEYLLMIADRSFVEADVLNSSGTQYLSLYSLGSGPSMAFQLERAPSVQTPSCG